MRIACLVALSSLAACGGSRAPATPDATPPTLAPTAAPAPDAGPVADAGPAPDAAASAPTPAPVVESHLADVRQLTFGGENAEAYWAWGGDQLILQARVGDAQCDRIYRMQVADGTTADGKGYAPVSNGKGATTCSYFMPGDKRVIYASTQLGGDACPPKPDHSKGYVWALYPSYEIFAADPDGQNEVRLTDSPGYDAEATVCGKDGSIVFTSVRDGDIELYRMDADGQNVKRLTHTPGYDGGAFFNADCTRLVWRASRPKAGPELDEFKSLLAENLVRPSKLEIYVGNADGSDPVQLTYLNAASFAPFWHPSGTRILFSSNVGDPKGREFDIWAIDTDGTRLERITSAPGFDGFPMFSPDGKTLAFASNRATPEGKHDTNVFVARWVEGTVQPTEESSADRIDADIAWLADPARDGRGVGTPGLDAAGAWVEERLKSLGLAAEGDAGSYRQAFDVPTKVESGPKTALTIGGQPVAADQMVAMGFSPPHAEASGDLVFAGYGIVAPEAERDDFGNIDAKGKVVLVRRFVPDGDDKLSSTEAKRRHGDIRHKAWLAKERGAAALLVVDDPAAPEPMPKDWKIPDEVKLPALEPEGYGDAGIPVVVVTRAVGHPLIEALTAKKPKAIAATVATDLTTVSDKAFNVIARLAAKPADGKKLPGIIVVGAHYDHLGHGGRYSLAPGNDAPHVGADDNASGTAALLEIARTLAPKAGELRRDVVFIAFSGEESGVLGSNYYVGRHGIVRQADLPEPIFAMLNMDMVGRMRENRLQVLGTDTASEWADLVTAACEAARVNCAEAGDGGLGPSDQMPFYLAGSPVLHFFTGTHFDYHKPSDTSDKINAGGAARTAMIVADLATGLATREAPLTFKAGANGPAPRGDLRSFNASLGTIPDYGGPGEGKKGVLLAGVRPGGAAEKAGLQKGDILIKLGAHDVGSVEDLMYVLNASKPGETTKAIVVRDGKEATFEVTFQESTRPK
ncbi:MAG: M20/M25/M40 family metallo-hydrolase [Myxococcota bacterium]